MNAGERQELRLVHHLHRIGYLDIIRGEAEIKQELELPHGQWCKCADVLAFSENRRQSQRIVVAESKGTDVAKAITQLGNAAAGVLNKFGSSVEITLLLYQSRLTRIDKGFSPGPGYLVGKTANPKIFVLLDATTSVSVLARARCQLDSRWSRWNSHLQKMIIEVFVEQVE